MLQDENEETRHLALDQILQIRTFKEDPEFKPKIKPKTVMKINFGAESWEDLINVAEIEVEPPTTVHKSLAELREAIETKQKLSLTDLPNNSQSVERAVKLTSEASKKVYGREKRHNFILTKNQSRKENKRNVNKTKYFIE